MCFVCSPSMGADGVLNFCLREFDRIGHERHGLARGVGKIDLQFAMDDLRMHECLVESVDRCAWYADGFEKRDPVLGWFLGKAFGQDRDQSVAVFQAIRVCGETGVVAEHLQPGRRAELPELLVVPHRKHE